MHSSVDGAVKYLLGHLAVAYETHRAILLMLLASFLTTLVATNAKILQQDGLSAEQVLLGGMGIKLILVFLYIATYQIPDAPFGLRQFRGLLMLRGVAGSVGILGIYYSLPYLDISVVTVITFLSPMIGTFAITLLLRTPLTKIQFSAAFISFAGVILIAKPWQASHEPAAQVGPIDVPRPPPTSSSTIEHFIAIGTALTGALGTAVGFVALSKIGTAVNPIISVGYFSVSTTIISAAIFIAHISTANMPKKATSWIRLGLHGVGSFGMQLLGAKAIAAERGTRVLNALYSQVVFALIVDKLVWDTTPDLSSILGGIAILGSVITVAITARANPASAPIPEEVHLVMDENVHLTVDEEDAVALEGLRVDT